jgi:hypothetical protein
MNFGHALWLAAALATLALGCSSSDDGSGNGNANGNGGEQPCTGLQCVELDIRMELQPTELNFTDRPAGEDEERTLTVRHIGTTGNLQINNVRMESASNPASVPEFEVLGWQDDASIAPSESVVWTVRYTPTAQGFKKLSLVIESNDKDQPTQTVPINVVPANNTLIVTPDPIDFGNVEQGQTVTTKATVLNAGTEPVSLADVSLSPTGSPDFAVTAAPEPDEVIPGGGTVQIELSYAPVGGNADATDLILENDSFVKTVVPVQGAEIAPIIKVLPPKLDFGDMDLESPKSAQLVIQNTGLATLNVTGIELGFGSVIEDITFSETPTDAAPIALEPQGSTTLDVTLTAKESLPNDGAPKASIKIFSNDPGKPEVVVPVYVRTATPKLQVTPPDEVDYAIVANGVEVLRTIELFNAGTADVVIDSIELTEDSGGEFYFAGGAPGAATMKPGGFDAFNIALKPNGPAQQVAKGKLVITSNDPTNPVWEIGLFGLRADGATCDIQFQPAVLNFGVIPYGGAKILKMNVKNVGTGMCELDGPITMFPCQAGLFGGGATCGLTGEIHFKSGAPETKLFFLEPGKSGAVQIEFAAPSDLGLFGNPNQITDFFGLVGMKFKDPSTGASAWYPSGLDPKDPQKIAAIKPNLKAGVGLSQVQVLPPAIDFGLVTVGCKSKVETVRVYNTGTTAAWVTKAALDGCGLEVDDANWPAIPKSGLPISQATPVELGLQYSPQNVGKDKCQLNIWTSENGQCADNAGQTNGNPCTVSADCGAGQWCMGDLYTVPLFGEGTLDDEFTDVFDQSTGKNVDVLFVIDNSGSMGDEQSNLATNFSQFISVATVWNTDYHIGVVTTDMDQGLGRLVEANGQRFISPKTSNPTSTFQSMVKVGTSGSADEQGLAASQQALSPPNSLDFDTPCVADQDCAPYSCVADDEGIKKCGGHNRGFLRKNSGLEVVYVSDEEDSSPADLAFYVNFLYSIKGSNNKSLFHAHAIVAPSGASGGGGPGGSGCDATGGNRYRVVAQDTAGKVGDICSASFATALKDIGEVAFGLGQQFFLTMLADEATIEVTVGGKPCAKGPNAWSYDKQSNSVIFVPTDKGGTCQPQENDKITIFYKTLCFP